MKELPDALELRWRAPIGSGYSGPTVADGRVYVTDGNAYFNRSGPRLVESLEILAEILHPQLFRGGHEHSGFRKLS